MKSLFDVNDNNELIQRIEQLKPDTEAKWGKMNVAQMLSHVQEPINVAFGKVRLKQSLIGLLFGRMAKKKMLKEEFSKNLPTMKSFIRKDIRDFEKEKALTISLLREFINRGPGGISDNPHPFFGKLTIHEWDTLGWKHLDHHLRQFGV